MPYFLPQRAALLSRVLGKEAGGDPGGMDGIPQWREGRQGCNCCYAMIRTSEAVEHSSLFLYPHKLH